MVAGKIVMNCVQTRFFHSSKFLRIYIQNEFLVEQNVNSAKLFEILIELSTSGNFSHLFTPWTFHFFHVTNLIVSLQASLQERDLKK